MPTHSELIRTYIQAKDENRPHLMKRAFADDATLEMIVETGAITFPPLSRGIEAITRVLVRDFGQTFENVYTFCLADPSKATDSPFSCSWLVGMSEKESGAVRVGCGRYDWIFQDDDPFLVQKLKITVSSMLVLSPRFLHPVMERLSTLPYPWCGVERATAGLRGVPGLEDVFAHIDRVRA